MTEKDGRQTADFVVERLRAWRVERLYGYAGDGNNPLLGALRRSSDGPEYIGARHEEGAAFMAVGEAKYGRGVGVVTSTQGPGAVHLLTGLYDAKLDSSPVVALVAQQHTSVLGSDYQQEIDLENLFRDVSPFVQTAAAPVQLPMALDRAFRSALTRSQPAVVILPHDVQQAPPPELGQEHGVFVTAPRWTTGRTAPDPGDLDAAVEVIEKGEKIAILAGQGVRHAQGDLIRLAETLGAGITTSLLGKPAVDETHPLAAGTMGHLGTPAANRILQSCDTLLIIGSDDPWSEFYPPPGQARAVQIDLDPAKLGNRYPVEVGVVGDSAITLPAILDRLGPRDRTAAREEVERTVRAGRDVARLRSEVVADPLNPELVVRRFGERIPDSGRLAVDVGSVVYHYVRQTTLPTSVDAHLSSTLASMGCSIPYGVAAKELAPDRPVYALSGDGAMQMLGINELITVAQRWQGWADPRFVVLVLHNRDLAEVSWEQREMESQPRFPDSQRVPAFSYASYAEVLGLRGIVLSDAGAITPALDEAFAADRPVLVEAFTDADVPLLPPFPHGREKLEPMRAGLQAEGEAGQHALRLLEVYAQIEEEHG